MVAIHLDNARQKQLERLASADGRGAVELVRAKSLKTISI